MTQLPADAPPPRQPIFNLPRVVVVLLIALVTIQLIRSAGLRPFQQLWVLMNFAFIPGRSPSGELGGPGIESLPGAEVWSFVTYALLHAGWTHVVVNGVWLAAFGGPLAWRFGATRFLLFSAVTAAAGAAAHLIGHGGEFVPMVGASAAVSGYMAGAARFLFIRPPGLPRSGREQYRYPAAPLTMVFTDRRTLAFLGVWFGINLVVGLTGIGAGGGPGFGPGTVSIAWEAHIGGFVAGLLLFPLFDPVRGEPSPEAV